MISSCLPNEIYQEIHYSQHGREEAWSQKRSSYVKRLFRDFANHPGLLILASIGTIVQVALTVWLPILIGHAVDLVINPQRDDSLMACFDPNGSGHC